MVPNSSKIDLEYELLHFKTEVVVTTCDYYDNYPEIIEEFMENLGLLEHFQRVLNED